MGDRITVQDVAKRAKVSAATVSRVFNGVSSVDPDMVKRVRKAASDLSYVPNPYGRALRRQQSDIWTVIVSDLQNPFYTRLVADIESIGKEQGFSVMLATSDEDLEKERRHIEVALSQQMAGVVISPSSESQTDLTALMEAGIPVVVVDRHISGYTGASVMVDNVQVGTLAAEHLLQCGYRTPAVMTSSKDVSSAHDRSRGFVDTLRAAGVLVPSERIYTTDLRYDSGRETMLRMLKEHPEIDSLFTVNGPLTAAAFTVFKDEEIAVPETVALVGVDDDQWTAMVTPAVTVVRQPVSDVGRIAGELLSQANGLKSLAGAKVVLSPELVVRESM